MTAIIDITGREILDSRGNPTVEVDVRLEDGALGRAAVPSGASTGAHEAVELRDGGKRYGGKGVEKAVAAVNGEIFDTLCGMEAEDQIRLDRLMCDAGRHAQQVAPRRQRHPRRLARRRQGRGRWRRTCRSTNMSAAPRRSTLPVPLMNIVNGGVHADNPIDFQEFMIMPVGAPTFTRSPAHGRRDLPHAEEGAARRRPQHQCRRRGRLRAEPEERRRSARLRHARHREGRLQARRRRHAGDGSGLDRILQERQVRAGGRGQVARRRRHGQVLRGPLRPLSHRLDRGRHGRRRLGRLGRASPRRSARRSNWSATIFSSPTPRASPRASRRASPTPS